MGKERADKKEGRNSATNAFFSFLLEDEFAPVIIHARWNKNTFTSKARLDILGDRVSAKAFHDELPLEQRGAINKELTALPELERPKHTVITGAAAQALGSIFGRGLEGYRAYGVFINKSIPSDLFCLRADKGFGFGQDIFFWFHPDTGYQLVLTNSKEQSEKVLERADWLSEEKRNYLKKFLRTSACFKKSLTPELAIGGIAAEAFFFAYHNEKQRGTIPTGNKTVH